MKLQNWAWLFAIVFIVLGILGYVPGITSNGMLFGIFDMDAMHSVIFIITGIVAAISAASVSASRTYFKVFGVIYALAAIIGFIQGDTIVGLMDVNMADHILHLVIAVVALWVGFGPKENDSPVLAS